MKIVKKQIIEIADDEAFDLIMPNGVIVSCGPDVPLEISDLNGNRWVIEFYDRNSARLIQTNIED